MKSPVTAVFLLSTILVHAQTPASTHLIHGHWFDGTRFVESDFYAENGVLTHTPHDPSHGVTIDLHGGFVVPPYGDSHEHNFDGVRGTAAVVEQYLRDGIFYAQGMTDTTVGAEEVIAAHLVDTPTTPDVTYAHGGLTAPNGHPKDVYDALALGFYYGVTPEQRAAVLATHARRGLAYWEIASPADLDAQWPRILHSKPDLIKVYLLHSERYHPVTADAPQFAQGLDPALIPLITSRAHAAGLKVAAHIDSAFDFHVAVTGGVDELGHLPGYGFGADESPAGFRLADADIALAARRHLALTPTAAVAAPDYPHAAAALAAPGPDLARCLPVERDNLRRLKAAGVRILVGSDHYSLDSRPEADFLQALGLWSNLQMLRMWAVDTPQAIYPHRRLGRLQPGYEASFLVLSANPLLSWSATHSIVDRWKQGTRIELAPPPTGVAGAPGTQALPTR